jgi:hypothetical protein
LETTLLNGVKENLTNPEASSGTGFTGRWRG